MIIKGPFLHCFPIRVGALIAPNSVVAIEVSNHKTGLIIRYIDLRTRERSRRRFVD